MEQPDEIYVKRLEYKVNCSQNIIETFRNGARVMMKEIEILQSSLHQYKKKIAQLEEKDIQSDKDSYEALKNNHIYYNKINDLMRINEDFKKKIAELEEKDIQSDKDSYEALKNNHIYYKKINDLMRINEELSREIDLNNLTKK